MPCTLYPDNPHDATLCPGCYSEPETKTRQDAYARVINARMGCFAGEPTEEYLVALRSQLYAFIDQVDAELHKLQQSKSWTELIKEEVEKEEKE